MRSQCTSGGNGSTAEQSRAAQTRPSKRAAQQEGKRPIPLAPLTPPTRRLRLHQPIKHRLVWPTERLVGQPAVVDRPRQQRRRGGGPQPKHAAQPAAAAAAGGRQAAAAPPQARQAAAAAACHTGSRFRGVQAAGGGGAVAVACQRVQLLAAAAGWRHGCGCVASGQHVGPVRKSLWGHEGKEAASAHQAARLAARATASMQPGDGTVSLHSAHSRPARPACFPTHL